MTTSDTSIDPGKRVLKVLSYNIHRGRGLTRRQNTGRVADLIRDINPDVVALQEVENSSGSLPASRQLTYLADRTGLTPIAGPTMFKDGGDYGNAILSRFPVLDVHRHDLSFGDREARGALDVVLAFEDTRLRVIATHFGLDGEERRFQKNRLKEAMSRSNLQPLILMGDMNEWLAMGKTIGFFQNYFGRTPARRTFPAIFPLFPLDRIFVSPDSLLKKIETIGTFQARLASDHLPLLAVLEL